MMQVIFKAGMGRGAAQRFGKTEYLAILVLAAAGCSITAR